MTKIAALTFFLFALAACASPTLPSEDFDDAIIPEVYTVSPKKAEHDVLDTDLDTDELLLLEMQDHVSNMKSKGATQSDCQKLAQTSCKLVEDEVKTDEKSMQQLKGGRECLTRGTEEVKTAMAELKRVATAWKSSKTSLTMSQNAKVDLGTHTFKSLEVGTCAIFHGKKDCSSPVVKFKLTMFKSYLKSKAIEEKMRRIELTWRSRVRQATRNVKLAKITHHRQVTHCLCNAKAKRDALWSVVGNRKRRAGQVTAHKKCKMMGCLVSHTPLSSRKCRSHLHTVKKKTLIEAAEAATRERCAATAHPPREAYSSGSATHSFGFTTSHHSSTKSHLSKRVTRFKKHIDVEHTIKGGKFVKTKKVHAHHEYTPVYQGEEFVGWV